MREYRQSSHTGSLAFWAVLCTATAMLLLVQGHRAENRVIKLEEDLGAVALIIFGPAALALYLIRARMVWIGVDPERGLVVSGRRAIAWDDVLSVQRRRPVFRKTSGPAEVPELRLRGVDAASGCADFGCLTGIAEVFLGVLLVVVSIVAIEALFAVLVPLLFIPLLEVFAPFGDRITVITRRGRIVLRDLRNADDFLRMIAEGTNGRVAS